MLGRSRPTFLQFRGLLSISSGSNVLRNEFSLRQDSRSRREAASTEAGSDSRSPEAPGQRRYVKASRPLEHPDRNLQPPIRIRPAQCAAENDATSLVDRLLDHNLHPEPRMPRIQQFPQNGPVGVLKPCCITTPGRTVLWAISHQRNTPMAASPDRNGAGRCATSKAPRPAPLLHRALWAQIPQGLFPSLDEAKGSDQSQRWAW